MKLGKDKINEEAFLANIEILKYSYQFYKLQEGKLKCDVKGLVERHKALHELLYIMRDNVKISLLIFPKLAEIWKMI